ncbi:hypothetical protein H4219_002137 [Mycoemilia scoparia]|uniref:Uncharacterized protein n=1 Tax=Mycoemilia scoparia TaxID=417184 RepID=A0A9W8DQZ3_9FUNG|nr:hypothetical protein H4219_002137 [Mycoemilia scoparia]
MPNEDSKGKGKDDEKELDGNSAETGNSEPNNNSSSGNSGNHTATGHDDLGFSFFGTSKEDLENDGSDEVHEDEINENNSGDDNNPFIKMKDASTLAEQARRRVEIVDQKSPLPVEVIKVARKKVGNSGNADIPESEGIQGIKARNGSNDATGSISPDHTSVHVPEVHQSPSINSGRSAHGSSGVNEGRNTRNFLTKKWRKLHRKSERSIDDPNSPNGRSFNCMKTIFKRRKKSNSQESEAMALQRGGNGGGYGRPGGTTIPKFLIDEHSKLFAMLFWLFMLVWIAILSMTFFFTVKSL